MCTSFLLKASDGGAVYGRSMVLMALPGMMRTLALFPICYCLVEVSIWVRAGKLEGVASLVTIGA